MAKRASYNLCLMDIRRIGWVKFWWWRRRWWRPQWDIDGSECAL